MSSSMHDYAYREAQIRFPNTLPVDSDKFLSPSACGGLQRRPDRARQGDRGGTATRACMYAAGPALTTKTVVIRDYGCKVPIDLADTEKLAKAVLTFTPTGTSSSSASSSPTSSVRTCAAS